MQSIRQVIKINSNPKHGTIDIKDATAENHSEIQYELLSLERQLGEWG